MLGSQPRRCLSGRGTAGGRPKAFRGCKPRGHTQLGAAATQAPTAQEAGASAAVKLPPSLRNSVAVLEAPNPSAPGGTTHVYVLGMSHVSQKSVDQVRELIKLVRPEVVAVELCKDRVGLMVDPDDALQPPTMWHSRKIIIDGLPQDPDWPTAAELKQLCVCQPGRPVGVRDIEGDVTTLLGTGLFKSIRPICDKTSRDEAPEFSVTLGPDGKPDVLLVPPLGAIRFVVQERGLPAVTQMSVRVDSSIKGSDVEQAALDAVCCQAVDDCKAGASAIVAYARCKKRFAELFPGQQVTVAYSGVDVGRVEAIVKAVKPADPAFMSGLESSAPNGEGFGIEPFRPMRNLFQVSSKMFIPQDTLDQIKAEARAKAAAAFAEKNGAAPVAADGAAEALSHDASSNGASTSRAAPASSRPRASLRPWTDEELAAAKHADPEVKPLADILSRFMTRTYARFQTKAGGTVGVSPGAAWRAALEAATEVGSTAVVLADRPTVVTERRMADDMLAPTGGRLAAGLALVLSTLIGTLATDALPQSAEAGVFVGSLAAAAAVAWPVIAPFLEISRFADMSKEQIEDAVAVPSPIDQGDLSKPLRLYGEDALLDWPGALPAIINERDLFMAKALAAAAKGAPGACPTYVVDQVDGQRVWRYGMPEGAPAEAAPQGFGDGAVAPIQGVRAVVGVVGSAHVHGMVREWKACVEDTDVRSLLQVS